MKLWKKRRSATIGDEIAARPATSAFEDPDGANRDALAKLQRETTGRRSAWNALTHRTVDTEWRGD